MGLLDRMGLWRKSISRASGATVLFPPENAYERNWFQLGRTPSSDSEALRSSAVYACVSVISQEIARLQLRHYKRLPGGGREEIRDSRVARVLRRPNEYQTRSDFFLNYVSALLLNGNAYGLAQRDSVGRIVAIHSRSPGSVSAQVDPDTGAVFYELSDARMSPDAPRQVPARDVAHARLFCPADPLVGVSPLTACAYSMAHGEQISRQSVAFWANQSRPAGVLHTDRPLSAEAAQRLRDQWESASSGDRSGKTAVLDSGLQWTALGLSPQDSAIVESWNLQVDDICRVFRVPLAMVQRLESSTFSNVEQMTRTFVASCLGFYLEALEATLNKFFALPGDQEIEFDVERGLHRSDIATRIAALKNGIQGGIFSPNEARAIEGLPPVDGGDSVYLQSQMEPLTRREQSGADPDPDPDPVEIVEPELDPDPVGAERIAELESQLSMQRIETSHRIGSLEADLAIERGRQDAE